MNQQLHIQRQQLRREHVELTSAIEQLENNPETYSMVGSLMVKQDAETVQKKLSAKLEDVKKQIAILDEQLNEPTTNA